MKFINMLLFALLIMVSLVQAEPGCMDNSWYLQKPVDEKEYHYVQCYCPCTKRHKILADRGQCIKCRHYRDPKPYIIITGPKHTHELASNIKMETLETNQKTVVKGKQIANQKHLTYKF